MLTIFFTGVPPLEESTDVPKEEAKLDVSVPVRESAPRNGKLYSHPVWAAGVCDPCHGTSGIFSVPGVESKAKTVFDTGGGIPGTLNLPKEKICIQCHTDKTAERALKDRLWLHNTVAKGDCLACHDPHQSTFPRTLRKPLDRICFPCHDKGEFWNTPVHKQDVPCLPCHSPHMGINRHLLTSEYRENKVRVTDIAGHPELDKRLKPTELP